MNVSVATVSAAPACCLLPAETELHHYKYHHHSMLTSSPSKRRAARQRVLGNLLTKDMIQKAFVKSPVKQPTSSSRRKTTSSALTENSPSSPNKRRIGALPFHNNSFTTSFDTAASTSKAITVVVASQQKQQPPPPCGCFATASDAGLGWTAPRTTSPRRRTVGGVATPRRSTRRVPATMNATARALRLELLVRIPALLDGGDGDAATKRTVGTHGSSSSSNSSVVTGCPTTATAATTTFKNKAPPLHKDQMTQETMAEIEDHRNYFRSLRPKRRQIKFNPQINDCCRTSVDGSPVHGSDSIDPTTTTSCHVQNISVQDLNIPSPSKKPTSALDDHLEAGAAGGRTNNNNNHHCPSLTSASLCSQSICSIRSAYEDKRIAAHEQKKTKARIQKLEIEIDNTNAKADYLDQLLHGDRVREEQLEQENLELRRHIVEGIHFGASWSGMAHQTMVVEEQRLQEQLRALDEEIALLEDSQVEEHVMASTNSSETGTRVELTTTDATTTATGASVSSQHSGILVDECLLLSLAPTVPVATVTEDDNIINETKIIAATIEESSPSPSTPPNITPIASPVRKSKKKAGTKKKKHESEREHPGGNGNYATPPTAPPDTTPLQRTASSRKKMKKKKAANVKPSLTSHMKMATGGSTDDTKSSSGSSTTSSGTKASRVWLDMQVSSPRLVVRAKRQTPSSI